MDMLEPPDKHEHAVSPVSGSVPERAGAGSGPERVPAVYLPFAGSGLPDSAFGNTPPLDALRAHPDIAGYLKRDAHDAGGGRARARAMAGMAICAAALFCLYSFFDWRIFERYTPPPVRETPKPGRFTGDIPLQYRGIVQEINENIEAGGKWRTVFGKLLEFSGTARNTLPAPPRELLLWADTEMLVALASKDIPPGTVGADGTDRLYGEIAVLAGQPPEIPVPYRAAAAYAAILHFRRESGGESGTLLDVLGRMREEHAKDMNGDPDVLALEADAHIRAFPPGYAANDESLAYHWRQAASALNRLYALPGGDGPVWRALERKRWQAVYAYFDITLLTASWDRFWRLEKIELDGTEYTRESVADILGKL